MLNLRCNRSNALFMHYCHLRRGWASRKAAVSTVIADPAVRVIDNPVRINVMNNIGVDRIYGTVVIKSIAAPVTAFVTAASVSVTVIHTAIEAYVRGPITLVPMVAAA